MKDYKDNTVIEELSKVEPLFPTTSEVVKENDNPEAEQATDKNTDASMLPKTPTGTRINKKGKNLILLAGAGIGLYIVWAIFGLTPKPQTTTGPQDAVNISSSALSNQQNQGQGLINTLRSQAYGNAATPVTAETAETAVQGNGSLPTPAGAVGIGQAQPVENPQGGYVPANIAGVAGGASQSNESNNGYGYSNTSGNDSGSNYNSNNNQGGQQQSPYQQAIQAGMQSGLTPDGFQSAASNQGSGNSSGYNSMSNNSNNAGGSNAALAANAAAIQAMASASNGSGDQNMQGEKNTFLQQSQNTGNDTLQNGVQNPASPFMIMAGSVIPATLITGINSDLPGEIQAIVSQNIYDSRTGNSILIPQGSRLIGTYDSQVAYGQSRVLIVWSRVIFPNDQYIDLAGMPGADLTGAAGLTDEVNNHYFKIYGSALLMSIFSAGMQLSQPQSNNASGAPTNQQIVAAAMGQELGQVSTQMIQKNLNIQPTINIRSGDNFNVLVTRDIPFSGPYSDNAQPQVLLPVNN